MNDVDVPSSPPTFTSTSSSSSQSSPSSTESTVLRRPRTSWIYKHMPDPDTAFRYFNASGKEQWRCKYCSKAYSMNGGTRIVVKHLQESHNVKESSPREVRSAKRQMSIEASICQPQKRRRLTPNGSSVDPDILEVLFTKLITTGNLPLQLIELPEFHDLVNYLNSDVEAWLPTSHNTAKKWLCRQYDMEKANIKEKIRTSRTLIHISADCWTSSNHLPILGITAHFISKEKRLEKSVLALRQIDGKHGGDTLGKIIFKVTEEFDFAVKLGYFQADNAGNNDTTCAYLQRGKFHTLEKFKADCLGLI